MTNEETWQIAWEATLLDCMVFIHITRDGDYQPVYMPRDLGCRVVPIPQKPRSKPSGGPLSKALARLRKL